MKRLFLLRHAKSSRDDPTLDDFDRPLAERGVVAAEIMGKRLAGLDARPALVLCSPARRTRATWDIMAPIVMAKAVSFEPDVYEATWRGLLGSLQQISPAVDSVLLIGHNPSLEELALYLADPTANSDSSGLLRLRQKFPTCALAAFRFPAAEWTLLTARSCQLDAFLTPDN